MGHAPARRKSIASAILVVLVCAFGAPAAAQAPPPGPPPPPPWLHLINTYRSVAAVSPLTEVGEWSVDARDLACHITEVDQPGPSVDPSGPCATPGAAALAPLSLQLTHPDPDHTPSEAIHGWLRSAFYPPALLNPRLLQTGFGTYSDGGNGEDPYHFGAVFDTARGETAAPSYNALYPIEWPSHGSVLGYTQSFPVQYPDPLSSSQCAGFDMPIGVPLTIQFKKPVDLSSWSLERNGAPVEVCAFDPDSYTSPDPIEQGIGRSVMEKWNFAVMVPNAPLVVGSTYTATMTSGDETETWSFEVGSQMVPAPTTFSGMLGPDEMAGTGADDVMYGIDGDDEMCGGGGGDAIYGGVGTDKVCGGTGDDVVDGGGGNDVVDGGDADDSLFGGSGNDVLKGGRGRNKLNGGSGRDTCVISGKSNTLKSCEVVRRKTR